MREVVLADLIDAFRKLVDERGEDVLLKPIRIVSNKDEEKSFFKDEKMGLVIHFPILGIGQNSKGDIDIFTCSVGKIKAALNEH